jgi:O-antigen/teichoic acid export membrane protein
VQDDCAVEGCETLAERPVSAPTRDLTATILRNAVAATAGSWAIKALNFVFMIYVVRTLGDVGLGRYATVVAFVGLFGVFVELGLTQYVERAIAQDRRRSEELIWNLVAVRLLLAGVGVVVITGLALALGYPGYLVLGMFLYTLTFFFAALLAPLAVMTTAHEQFHRTALIAVSGQFVTIICSVTLLQFGQGFFALVLAGLVAMPLQIAFAAWLVRRANYGRLPFLLTPRQWKPLIVASLPFGLTSLALTFNFNVDTVILGWFRDEATVGWYSASYRLIFNAVGLVGGFLIAMTPSLARVHYQDPARVARWVSESTRWLLLFSLPVAAGLALLAPRIIALLYGAEYAPAAPAFRLLAWDVPLLLLLSFFGNVTAATERERPAALIFLGCAAANVALNLALIPRFGIVAAASVTVVTDLLCIAAFVVLLRALLPLTSLARDAARLCFVTGAMALTVWLGGALPLAFVIALGMLTFGVLALWAKLIDVRVLAGAFGRARRSFPTS